MELPSGAGESLQPLLKGHSEGTELPPKEESGYELFEVNFLGLLHFWTTWPLLRLFPQPQATILINLVLNQKEEKACHIGSLGDWGGGQGGGHQRRGEEELSIGGGKLYTGGRVGVSTLYD